MIWIRVCKWACMYMNVYMRKWIKCEQTAEKKLRLDGSHEIF